MARSRLISRPDDPYRGMKRVLRTALVISLLLHPLIIALLLYQLHFRAPQIAQRQRRDPSEIVTVTSAQKDDRRRVARREPPPRQPTPRRVTRPKTAPVLEHAPDQVARVVPKPIAKPVTVPSYPPLRHDLAKDAHGTPEPKSAPVSKSVAMLQKPAATQGEAKTGVRHYSAEQLAQINNDFAKTAQSLHGANNPLSNVTRQVSTAEAPKHYSLDFQALNGRTGQGICEPVKEFDNLGYDYYYMICNLVEPDGSAARLPLPWPIRYKPHADPYKAGYAEEGPIPLPPPEWKPDLSHPMDPVYLGYLREKGYPI
jgi:hypothetical protein